MHCRVPGLPSRCDLRRRPAGTDWKALRKKGTPAWKLASPSGSRHLGKLGGVDTTWSLARHSGHDMTSARHGTYNALMSKLRVLDDESGSKLVSKHFPDATRAVQELLIDMSSSNLEL